MLKINNNVKKYKIPLIAVMTVISGVFFFQYLTFVPEYSSAEEIPTPVMGEDKTDKRTLSQITYMQEMTSGICERSAENETKQLIDTRDNKSYWVAKLKDSNCWMTQNLDFDLEVGTKLVANDSDVETEWTPSANTINGNLSGWQNSTSIAQSWDPGMYVYSKVNDNWNSCGDGLKSLSSCSRWSIIDDNWTADTSVSVDTINSGIDAVNKTYDAHYLIGNFYNYTASTAGSLRENADSICPKGWVLPVINDYKVLKDQANLASSNVRQYAVFFVPGGFANADGLSTAGALGNYWSSTPATTGRAYSFYFNNTDVYPENHYGSQIGRSVRCINNPEIKDAVIDPDVLIPNPNVSVMVDEILTLEVTNKEVNIEPKTSEVMTGEFMAKVSSNAGYDITLSTAEGKQTAMVNDKDALFNIPATNDVKVGSNGWGIKCVESEDCMINNYSALTEYNNPKVYFSSATGAAGKETKFEVGVGISPALPSGTYSTNILVTASQK